MAFADDVRGGEIPKDINADMLNSLGILLLNNGDIQEGLRALQASLGFRPSAEVNNLIAQVRNEFQPGHGVPHVAPGLLVLSQDLAPSPTRTGRGFWGWVRLAAVGVFIVAIAARVLNAWPVTPTAPSVPISVGAVTPPRQPTVVLPTGELPRPIIVDVDAWDSETVNVYDYTTTDPWTALVISTVEEFNAIRPPTAPRLVYIAASGDAECLDITNTDVWKLTGIIVCDTLRPEDFPYDPNAPVEGWGGFTDRIDDDTTEIVLNNFVPDGYYRPAEVADNTVCHEMMHAYAHVLEDHYDSDGNSCVFGELLSPGTTDILLMEERWPVTALGSSTREPGGVVIPGEVADPTPTPQRTTSVGDLELPSRIGCDPAYPDARTCIPPGPPFNLGCKITNERLFTVLPPDPQGLDRDKDGIGCEPVG
jgi:hypothetical protein